MVSMREIHQDSALELFDGDRLALYHATRGKKMLKIAISRREAIHNLVLIYVEAEYTPIQISYILKLSKKEVSCYMKRPLNSGFVRAKEIIPNPITLLEKSSEYAFEYKISSKMGERLLIEIFAMAGWTAKQIFDATGLNYRTIQRARKKVKEMQNEK